MTRFFLWFESFIRLRGMILFGGIFIVLCSAQKVSYAQDRTGSFEFEGHNRDYIVFFPDNYSNKEKFPLLIYLHSYDFTSEIEMEYTQLNLVTDTSGFILVAPNAVDRHWNTGGENPA
jgi:polyhydroxybutyrate depolymerase